ncbi:hypothetical protein FOZ61_002088 [Perkinsus olseni]|uniref:Uncharacterized protein n=1 Tax=Perkinsus olseni TaxID=32597 RepID=A0A7J6KP24_PEROL|nr:hypothetical protein FOZ61_002088 [Perkinsus olseni]
MEKVFLSAGFELPLSKRHDSDRDPEFKHLGLDWSFRQGNLVLSCRKSTPSGLRLSDGSFNMRWSARLLLGIAGCGGTGVDPCRLDCDARLAGDLLRSIVGKASKHGMDNKVCLDDDVAKSKILSSCFTTPESYSVQRCEHWCYGGSRLECFGDASPVGYGWCIEVPSGTDTLSRWSLAEHSDVWWGAKASYHINRKELMAISSAILYLHGMFCGHRTISPPVSSITIYADSQTALRWLEKRIDAKSIEKVAVQRLVCCINELVSDIRACGIMVTYSL